MIAMQGNPGYIPLRTNKGWAAMKKAILIVFAVCLGLIGFIGWSYGQTKRAPFYKQPPTDHLADAGEQAPADATDGGAYFAVPGWGVRFPLPKELRGDVISSESNSDVSGSIIFASKRLHALVGDSSCDLIKQSDGSYTGGLQASLVRIDPKQYPADDLATYKRQLVLLGTLDGYEYYARKQTRDPPVTCLTGGHEEHQAVEQAISDQLNDAFRHIELIK